MLQRPAPPLLLAGDGDRMLRLAAREADTVGFSVISATTPGADPQKVLANRVELVRAEAGERFAGLELNLFVSAVVLTGARDPDLTVVREIVAPRLADEQILQLPGVLVGSEQQIAETLLRYRETHGLTYFSVLEPHMTDFAKVISQLR